MINNPVKQLPIINVTSCQSDTQLDQFIIQITINTLDVNQLTEKVVENSEITIEHVKPILIKMEELLEANNSDVEDYLDELKNELHGSNFDGQLIMLEESIDNFDFENALISLRNIMKEMSILKDQLIKVKS